MDSLHRLRAQLLAHLDDDPRRRPLGGAGLFHSRAPQQLHAVPLRQPTLVLVLSGEKRLALGHRHLDIGAGELLLAPADSTVSLGNHPDPRSGTYLAVAIGFSDAAIDLFRRQYAAPLNARASAPLWHARAPEPLLTALEQWCDWCRRATPDPLLATHRHAEFLLLLARAGLAGNLLLGGETTLHRRVYELLLLDPSHDWQAREVSARLGVGESSLRRLLAAEGSGFRELLEEARLVSALALLQETFWPVSQVAATVGYRSASRFSARFRARFGVTPAALRQTRVSVAGAALSA